MASRKGAAAASRAPAPTVGLLQDEGRGCGPELCLGPSSATSDATAATAAAPSARVAAAGAAAAAAETGGPIGIGELEAMMSFFAENHDPHSQRDGSKLREVQRRCISLFKRDYHVDTVSNSNGELCHHYPLDIVLLQAERQGNTDETNRAPGTSTKDQAEASRLFHEGRFARTRSRFAVPVILHGNTNICRSATLATKVEIKCREGYEAASNLFGGGRAVSAPGQPQHKKQRSAGAAESQPPEAARDDAAAARLEDSVFVAHHADAQSPSGDGSLAGLPSVASSDKEDSLTARYRTSDIELLEFLGVKFICDLMVEERKIKYGLTVTSSEKVDTKGRYNDFSIAHVPYPGVEWFKEFKDNHGSKKKVSMDWDHPEVNVTLKIPPVPQLDIEWQAYREWDLVELSQNYLLLFLQYLRQKDDDGGNGMLIHCISGWDRTPLFVSMMRLSLWADGEVHQSLSALEVLYLTVGYDWLLFGHLLKNRLGKGEEIFLFCFDFLQFITSERFAFQPSAAAAAGQDATSPSPGMPRRSEAAGAAAAAAAPSPVAAGGSPLQRRQRQNRASSFDSDDQHRDDGWQSPPAPPSLGVARSSPMAIPCAAANKSWRSSPGDACAAGSWQLISPSMAMSPPSHGSGVSHRLSGEMDSPSGAGLPADEGGRLYNCPSITSLASMQSLYSLDRSDAGSNDNVAVVGRGASSPLLGTHGTGTSLRRASFSSLRSLDSGKGATVRAQRLHEVRDLFLPVYMRCLRKQNSGASVWEWISGSWASIFSQQQQQQAAAQADGPADAE